MMPSSVKRRRKADVAPKPVRKRGGYLLDAAHAKPRLDRNRTYRKACAEMADELGFNEAEILAHWIQCCLMRMFEQSLPQSIAEKTALEDVRAMLDKRGGSPS